MGDKLYYWVEMGFSICIALLGLIILLFPQKCLKPALLEKKNGKLIGRIIGVVFIICGIILVLLQV